MQAHPTTITRRLEWDSAHRVLRHESKCGSLHGHRYVALITCSADELDACDRVVDFGVIKERVGAWIDEHWDHTTLVNNADQDLWQWCWHQYREHSKRAPFGFNGEPTAETIAERLMGVAQELLDDTGVRVDAVEVFETPNCSAKVLR
jgi:6-pyruvoyltetrahydropterin/6-carboxytetrahydropterin synthase